MDAAERQPTYPEGGPKDNETYAEDGSGGDDIDTGRTKFTTSGAHDVI